MFKNIIHNHKSSVIKYLVRWINMNILIKNSETKISVGIEFVIIDIYIVGIQMLIF